MKPRHVPPARTPAQLFAEALEALQTGQRARAKTAFNALLKREPNHLDGHFLLGTLHAESGEFPAAVRHLRRAAELSPRSARVWNNLATTHRLSGAGADAVMAYVRALSCEPDMAEAGGNLASLIGTGDTLPSGLPAQLQLQAWAALGQFHQLRGDATAALAAYRRGIALDPGNDTISFQIAALEGRPMSRRPPADVKRLFDGYAEIFDEHLVDRLGYRVPELIAALLGGLDGGAQRYRDVLDLGCGTGLSGIAIRPRAARLTGVDLSPRMLDKARATGAYDEVVEQDLYEFLAGEGPRYDLVLAADVLVYLGPLDDLLAAIRRRASDGALLWLSVELNSGPEDYRVGAEGRYLQSLAYVRRAAAGNGWEIVLEHEVPLRSSGDDASAGIIVALRALIRSA